MSTLIITLYSFLMSFVGSSMLMATVPHATSGEKYAAVKVEYHPEENRTYAVWVRYYVQKDSYTPNNDAITARGGQVWSYPGNVSLDEIKKDGRERADSFIEVSVTR